MLHKEWVRNKKLPLFFTSVIGIVLLGAILFSDLQYDNQGIVFTDTWYAQDQSQYETTASSARPSSAASSGGFLGQAQISGSPTTLSESLGLAKRSSPPEGNIGFAVGGAQDINNFRKNIENNFLPLFTDITYEGLFYDYYFDTGKTQQCLKLFCPSYSYAMSADPLSENDEYYLSVGLNSGMKQTDFQRKKLNLVIVLDVSGSMSSQFNKYYYDQFGNQISRPGELTVDDTKTKIQLATESVVGLIDHLNDEDRLGIVLFESSSHLAKPLESMKTTDKERLENNILEIHATGGTNMAAGMKLGTSLFDEVKDSNQSEYENRIIFLTDAMPNLGDTSENGLFGMIRKNAENKIHTTFIGIGVDFNTELIEQITKVRGTNYYSVHSAADFKERMVDEFEFMVTPLVFDLVLSLEADGYKIIKVYGSPEANEATGEIMRVNTLFPSKVEDDQTKGGIVLLKLEKTANEGTIQLKTSYENRVGQIDGDQTLIEFGNNDSNFYDNSGIRKGILLTRYAELMKNWVFDERQAYSKQVVADVPSFFYEDGIQVPDYLGKSLGKWERQSIPLRVSGEYRQVIGQFNDYFKEEITLIDDYDLIQEVAIMEKLTEYAL